MPALGWVMPDGGRQPALSEVEGADGGGETPDDRSVPSGAGWVVLEVADTGVGIPEEVRGRIFEPFFTTKGAQGSGLGLAMVRKVVRAHGGELLTTGREIQGSPQLQITVVSRDST